MKKEYKMSFDNFNWNVDLERNCSREFTMYEGHEYITVRVSTEILSKHEKIKIIDLINRIANGDKVPQKIKAGGYIWNYEESFGQYKNSEFQELIKYLHGDYNNSSTGLTYPAIFNFKAEIIEYY